MLSNRLRLMGNFAEGRGNVRCGHWAVPQGATCSYTGNVTYFGSSEGVLEDGGVVVLDGVHAPVDDALASLPARLLHRKHSTPLLRQFGTCLNQQESSSEQRILTVSLHDYQFRMLAY